MPSYDIRRAETRGELVTDWLDARFSFSFAQYRHPQRMHFGALRALNEDRIQPGTGFGMHPHHDMEIFLMPLSGYVAHADSLGNQAVLQPGDVLRMSAGSGIEHSQMNGTDHLLDHHLQIWLTPRRTGGAPQVQWRHFDARAHEDSWQLIASEEGCLGSLTMRQDARIWRASLLGARALAFEPMPDALIYLHVIAGSLALETQAHRERLGSADGLAWAKAERFTLRPLEQTPCEVLLIEMQAR